MLAQLACLIDCFLSSVSVHLSISLLGLLRGHVLIVFAVKFVVRGLPPRCDGVDPRRQHPELVTEGMEIEISAS